MIKFAFAFERICFMKFTFDACEFFLALSQPYFSVAGPAVWNSLPDFILDPTISADCLDVCLKRICSLDTSAFSAL